MMKKIFKQNINKIIIIAVWLLIWQAAASLTGLELILAGPVNVVKALCTKLGVKDFYIAAGGSFVHIFAGFIIAFVTACIIGFLASFCRWLREFLRPAIVIMQSLPIASFIIVLIIWFGSKNVASYISFIVVFPMIYNSVITGVGNVDSKILEMAQVFNVSCWKKIRCVCAAVYSDLFEIGTWNVLESRNFGRSNRTCDTFNRRTAVLFKIISDDGGFICMEYSSCIYEFYF